VGGDERRPVRARGAQHLFDSRCDVDVRAQADGDGVRRLERVRIVVGQFQPRKHEQPVEAPGTLGFKLELFEIRGMVCRVHLASAARRVVGDR
jgi:hypothetical protein